MGRASSNTLSTGKLIFIVAVLAVHTLLSSPSRAEKLVIIHPMPESPSDTRWNYHWEILEAALKATEEEGDYEVRQSSTLMVERRALKELVYGNEIDIIRDNAGKEIEQLARPIRIPLLKGILGHRVFLIRKSRQKDFSEIQSLEAFKESFVVGAGQGWATVRVLEANAIPVMQTANYEDLFAMLMRGRFDAFPRGINEAASELEARSEKFPDMAIEENLMLRYPFYEYFFVKKNNERLAARIERGLNVIVENGTMDEIFDKYFGKEIAVLGIENRIVLDLENPDIDKESAPDRKELFFEHYLKKKASGAL